MNDLEDVALEALDAMESADAGNAGEPDGADDAAQNGAGGDDASTTNTDDNGAAEGDTQQGSDGSTDDNGEESDETEQKPNENGGKTGENGEKSDENDENSQKSDKKEMTDEEFEKLAKERGYFKQQPQQQQRQPLELSRPEEIDEKTWNGMPEINRIIYKQLPTISVRGTSGDETEPRVYTFKTPTQLPDDFKFASDKEKALFDDAVATQSRRADAMEQRINQHYARQQQQSEANMVVAAVDKLQADGIIPKITAKNGTPEFDKDPGVIAANNILAFWKQRTDQGAKMSIEDAAIIYKSTHPNEFKQNTSAKGDAERKSMASKIGGGRKSADNATNKKGYQRKYWRPGLSTEEVAEMAMEDLD